MKLPNLVLKFLNTYSSKYIKFEMVFSMDQICFEIDIIWNSLFENGIELKFMIWDLVKFKI